VPAQVVGQRFDLGEFGHLFSLPTAPQGCPSAYGLSRAGLPGYAEEPAFAALPARLAAGTGSAVAAIADQVGLTAVTTATVRRQSGDARVTANAG